MKVRETAFYAGSFDPPTNGHMWVIEEAAKKFSNLIVAVGVNPKKKSMFLEIERIKMLRECVESAGLKNVRVVSYSGRLTAHVAHAFGADVLVRGIRGVTDMEQERIIEAVNKDLVPSLRTEHVLCPPQMVHVSSSMVKELLSCRDGELCIGQYVPSPVRRKIMSDLVRGGREAKLITRGELLLGYECSEGLIDRYKESHRRYHNLQHIEDCLDEVDQCKHLLGCIDTIEVAIWFHDAIYNPRAKDNEEQSAELMKQWMSRHFNPETLCALERMILVTRHRGDAVSVQEKYLADIDLTILGQPDGVFDEYEENIRTEYSFVPEDVFKSKRAEILQSFLNRPSIYYTEFFQTKYEEQARRNLARSIESPSSAK